MFNEKFKKAQQNNIGLILRKKFNLFKKNPNIDKAFGKLNAG